MSAPDTLLLKILLVPVLIASVTLVGRRYGQRVGGWLGSFPIVAGPILFVLAFENGAEFGAAAAYSAFIAIVPAMIFYVVYARLALRATWWIATVLGIVVWCLVAGLLWRLELSMVFPSWLSSLRSGGPAERCQISPTMCVGMDEAMGGLRCRRIPLSYRRAW